MKTKSLGTCLLLICCASALAQTPPPQPVAGGRGGQPPIFNPVPQADLGAAKPDAFLIRHQAYVNRAKQGNIDLLFLGDSITEGWALRGPEVWDKYYSNMKAANFGIGGDQTQHVLWRIENGELENISP